MRFSSISGREGEKKYEGGAQLRASFNFPVRFLFYSPSDVPETGLPVYREGVVLFKEEK